MTLLQQAGGFKVERGISGFPTGFCATYGSGHPVIAILVTPAFVAGIHRVRSRVYQPINAISAAVWAVGIGVGGYLVGPPVLDAFQDVGLAFSVIIVAVVVAIVALEVWRRRRKRRP